jgi:hypothetical protein
MPIKILKTTENILWYLWSDIGLIGHVDVEIFSSHPITLFSSGFSFLSSKKSTSKRRNRSFNGKKFASENLPQSVFRKIQSEVKRYKPRTSTLSLLHLHTQSLPPFGEKSFSTHLGLKRKIDTSSTRINTHPSINIR